MATHHGRSNSFSFKAVLFVPEIEEQLNRINSSRSASSSSSSRVYNDLISLQDLHESVDKLFTRTTFFSKEQHKKWVDELLDRSLRLLDLCCVANDALTQTKESLLELQSTIRRKNGVQETECKKYLASRKSIKKIINKGLQSLQAMQKNKTLFPSSEDEEASTVVAISQEIEAATLSVFGSLFSLISGSDSQSKQSSWLLVSKVLHKKKVAACDEEKESESNNEFRNVDVALHRTNKSVNVQEMVRDLETCIEDLEESLDQFNRRLIKTRVSLLNSLDH